MPRHGKSTHIVEGVVVEIYDLGEESFAARVSYGENLYGAKFDEAERIHPLPEGILLETEDQGIPYAWPTLPIQYSMLHAIKERRYQSGLMP